MYAILIDQEASEPSHKTPEARANRVHSETSGKTSIDSTVPTRPSQTAAAISRIPAGLRWQLRSGRDKLSMTATPTQPSSRALPRYIGVAGSHDYANSRSAVGLPYIDGCTGARCSGVILVMVDLPCASVVSPLHHFQQQMLYQRKQGARIGPVKEPPRNKRIGRAQERRDRIAKLARGDAAREASLPG
jgi:hypothetical protein